MQKIGKIYGKISAKLPETGTIIALIVLVIVTTIFNPTFLTFENISTLFKSIPFIALVTLGSSLCLTSGSLDIACGRVAGLCGMVFGFALTKFGFSLPVAILCGIGCGAAFGALHGLLIVYCDMNAFIVTMGTLYVAGGLRYMINNGDPMNLPESYRNFSQATPLGISWLFWIAVAIFVIMGFVESKTVYGRRIYATGSNAEVAKLQGVNYKLIRFSTLLISGIFAGMAGVMATIDINSSQAATGTGWEFKAVAACFLGGVSLSGGTGRAFGVALGVFIVFVINNVIQMIGLSAFWINIFTGCVLLGSVLIDVFRSSRKIRA